MRVNLLQPAGHAVAPAAVGDNVFGDLGVELLCAAMANDDPSILEAVRTVLAAPVTDPEVIRHRHEVLADCRAHPAVVRELYRIATEATEVKRWRVGPAHHANGKLVLALQPLTELVTILRRLRAACDRDGRVFGSAGFTDLMATVATELDDGYLDGIETQLSAMDFEYGIHISAGLGGGNTIAGIVLHEPIRRRRFGFDRRTGHVFRVIEEPQPEFDPVMRLRDRALAIIADVVDDAANHVQDFFRRLRTEIAFYLGCLTLHDRLSGAGLPLCLPTPHPAGTARLRCTGLRDIALCLSGAGPVVGNDIDASGRSLIVVTGANSGGKSTFLRSVGMAQLMMQAGMFVVADTFEADVRDGVFTHFVTDEDRTMSHGKLVDELSRMSGIVDRIGPNSLLLCNESFSSTSEGDATRIAGPLLDGLLATGVRIVFVTHLYEFAHRRYRSGHPADLFLRAGHHPDGTRSFRVTAGSPEPTSHAADIFRDIFDRAP
ncbi:MutS-related protein [Nocardia terpenica]|uniref:DNA mismatch repair protein n=1 Tax=Nocardia terpenica TaxID=455432 RepID=A0A6G9ZAJ6_9NOCA|nr:DNA mismatch repair protein [Nocardia terpenica]QIS22625.1 DNA mismatch repair protein [Nocardia terpenica]